jgi:pimeloyl-ACP methyl ester carboxylesterase
MSFWAAVILPPKIKSPIYLLIMKRYRAGALISLGVLMVLALIGALYQSYASARDARQFPPPGVLVDIGGRRLHLVCVGQGTPIVLFEHSGFGNALSDSAARSAIATQTRVCSYDQIGIAWSDPAPRTLSVGMLADDLRALQDRASLDPPFIIVTSSIGGLTTEMFARRYPDRVAGLVFLDAANSELLSEAAQLVGRWSREATCLAATTAGRLGLIRLLDPFRLRRDGSEVAARSAAFLYNTERWLTLCSLIRAVPTSVQEFAAAPDLPRDVPLVVLSAETADGLLPQALQSFRSCVEVRRPLMLEAHKRLAGRSTRGSWRIVAGSDHLIASGQPHVVVDAVLEMLRQNRGR